ncbi:MAG: pyridoxal-phosphate dependent enzyme, partial [Pseudonocardiaceae bacterium]
MLSHAYDHPLIAARAGTLALEVFEDWEDVDTIVIAVGGGGLFSGTTAAVAGRGVGIVAVEPENCRALNASIAAGRPVDVPVDSVAADSLGARRVSQLAHRFSQASGVSSILVSDRAIVRARQSLWDSRRVVVKHGATAGLAALQCGAYVPAAGERVAVVLCGANT